MKRIILSTSILFMASTSAFAHHPAEDIVDPEIYAMIDENVADTPHADLTFDDMGSTAVDTTVDTTSARSTTLTSSRATTTTVSRPVVTSRAPVVPRRP